MSYKGRFKPKHYNKYKGDPTKIIYRSLWERRFMVYCDDNPNILKWSSEELIIPYRMDDGTLHRYYPDFMIEFKDKNGSLQREVIEVKPKKQCVPPVRGKKSYGRFLAEVRTYRKNECKWDAAREYCLERGYKFRILTEDHLVN